MPNTLPIANLTFEDLILPENQLEETLLLTPEFNRGLAWGIPRSGHPEGQVGYHIAEVLENIEQLSLSAIEREILRIVAIAHDTFKFKEEELRYWNGDFTQHHGLLAARFMQQYTTNATILKLIEFHDEVYYTWKMNDETRQKNRLERFIENIGDDLQLFYAFFICDTMTGDKTKAPITWFESYAKGMIKLITF